eukprot:scaffold30408_cov35-Prasinocladus_malaysianus.AAC.1
MMIMMIIIIIAIIPNNHYHHHHRHRQEGNKVACSAALALPGPLVEGIGHGFMEGAAGLWAALAAFLAANQTVFYATASASFK